MTKLADARRMALARGARLEIDGRTFNAAGETVKPAKRVAAPPPEQAAPAPAEPAAPPAVPGLTRAEAEQMLFAMETRVLAELQDLRRLLLESRPAAVAPAAPSSQTPWGFQVQYDERGGISGMVAAPVTNTKPKTDDEWEDHETA